MARVSIAKIGKRFNGFEAVKNLSLEIPAGTIYGLLGPNGAGKTTTIRMLLNIIAPDTGTVRINGQLWSEELKNKIGYLPEERGLYRKMKVADLLLFLAEIKGVPRAQAKQRMTPWLARLDLEKWKERKAEELSKGMQQKLQFIATVLHEPELVVLDEPFSGLDPVNTDILKDIVLELRQKGTTVLFSTHVMEQAEKLCDAICLINRGQKVLEGSLGQIKSRFGRNSVRVAVEGDGQFLRQLPGVQKIDDYTNYAELQLSVGAAPQAILQTIAQRATVKRFEVVEPSLHQIFLEVVRDHPTEKTGEKP